MVQITRENRARAAQIIAADQIRAPGEGGHLVVALVFRDSG
jgi:hypothetical protein